MRRPTEIHQPDDLGLNADLLYVRGRWVFDSLHEGWNELHPIKVCTRVGGWDGAWPAGTVDVQKRLDEAFDAAERDDVVRRQEQPEHQWRVHPLVDGCDKSTGAGARRGTGHPLRTRRHPPVGTW